MTLSEVLTLVQPYLPVVAWVLVAAAGIGVMAANHRLHSFLRETVAAVYRVAIHAASELGDGGLRWLRSEDGINFRKRLAKRAYAAIPGSLGPVPVGMVKLLISEEQFIALVEGAFEEVVALAEKLELEKEAEKLADRMFLG